MRGPQLLVYILLLFMYDKCSRHSESLALHEIFSTMLQFVPGALKKYVRKKKAKYEKKTQGNKDHKFFLQGVKIYPDTLNLRKYFLDFFISRWQPEIYRMPDGDSIFIQLDLAPVFSERVKSFIRNIFRRKTAKSKHRWFTSKGVKADYSFGHKKYKPNCFDDGLAELGRFFYFLTFYIILCFVPRAATLLHTFTLNSFNLAKYVNSFIKLGWHSDDEKIFNPNIICSFSMFATGVFCIRNKRNKKLVLETELTDFTVCWMVGKQFQANYEHCITKVFGYRLNVTWRHVLLRYS